MTNQKPELSKQQILESIGRIVADGEGRGSGPEASALPEAEPAPAAADDILDLVDMVDGQGNLIHLHQERESAPEAAEDGRTGEAQLLEMLRPMLQTWLDTHMPPIVERLVEREIERVSSRSNPE